jgi:hypothetical protein
MTESSIARTTVGFVMPIVDKVRPMEDYDENIGPASHRRTKFNVSSR